MGPCGPPYCRENIRLSWPALSSVRIIPPWREWSDCQHKYSSSSQMTSPATAGLSTWLGFVCKWEPVEECGGLCVINRFPQESALISAANNLWEVLHLRGAPGHKHQRPQAVTLFISSFRPDRIITTSFPTVLPPASNTAQPADQLWPQCQQRPRGSNIYIAVNVLTRYVVTRGRRHSYQ